MQHDVGAEVEAAALADIATAAAELLERLRATSDPDERQALRAEFDARVDGLREDLERRHGLDEGRAEAVIARSLARVVEVIHITPSGA